MAFQLQILHASDFEAGIPALDDAVRFSTVINALKDDYANTLILSSGDNYLPGPFFNAASDPALTSVLGAAGIGRADIAILNEIGIQASAFGNHEFDLGTSTIQSLLAPVRSGNTVTYPGAAFPYLSTNLNFANDTSLRPLTFIDANGNNTLDSGESTDGREASTLAGRIARYTTITVDGQKVGIVGATTPTLASISSPGPGVGITPNGFPSNPTPQQLDALAAEIQQSVDALVAAGVNKIVLLAHMQQLPIERELAKRLQNVDVIIAGGSHQLTADEGDRLRPGDTRDPNLTYPIVETNSQGQQVLVLNTAANYRYVGRLVVEFNDSGVIDFTKLNAAINGVYATDEASVTALTATNAGAPDPEVVAITNALRNVIATKDASIFGKTDVFLNGLRNDVRAQETNFGNLTADANLAFAREQDASVVISLKNGGGIRDNIGVIEAAPGATDPNDVRKLPPQANPLAQKEEGDISQLDIENSLRFNNGLTLLTVSAAELKGVMENAVSGLRPDGSITPGAFPQVSGLSFSFDVNRTARRTTTTGTPPNAVTTVTTQGDRIRSLAVTDEQGNPIDVVISDGQIVGDPNRTFRVVTLNFLAGGGDGYFNPGLSNPNRVDLFTGTSTAFEADGREQKVLSEFLQDNFDETPFAQVDVGRRRDTRVQNLAFRDDEVLGDPLNFRIDRANNLTGTNSRDFVRGASFNDTLNGLEGRDVLQGRAGDDVIRGGRAVDFLYGGNGRDTLFGEQSSDQLFGDGGQDLLFGGEGDDLLDGGLGQDRLRGGTGNDTLRGGAGNDTFVLGAGLGSDLIQDLNVEIDKIALEGTLAFNGLSFAQEGNDTLIRITGSNELLATVVGVQSNTLVSNVFIAA